MASSEDPNPIHGMLNLNKPPGMASFGVVGLVRRLTGVRRVGHAGTLDPAAEGVLPICLGQATRVVEHLVESSKTYRAEVRLGAATDTYDATGRVTATGDASGVTEQQVEDALRGYRGRIEQLAPMYSALKHEGTPLYRLARAGQTVERKPRPVTIHRLELLEYAPPLLRLEVECGRGAYIRTIAHDLGQDLGCGAHLAGLIRTKAGPFLLEDSLSLEGFREAVREDVWEGFLHATDSVLTDWRAAILGEEHTRDVMEGRAFHLTPVRPEDLRELAPGAPCRAYSADGRFLAILRYGGSRFWRPSKVFARR